MELLLQFKKYLLQDKNKPSKATVKNYIADVRKFIGWFENTFHKEFIPNLVTKDLVAIYNHSISQPNADNQIFSASTVKRYQSSLRKFYTYLLSTKMTTENPFAVEQTEAITPIDLFHLKEFKNFLTLSHTGKLTRKNYMMDLGQFVHWLKNLPQEVTLKELNETLVEEYKNRLLYEAKFSPASVNRKLSSLRKYFAWAKSQNLMPSEIELEQVRENISEDIQTDQEEVFNLGETLIPEKKKQYSNIPPVRLIQKLFNLGSFGFDLLFLLPIVKGLLAIKYQWWKLTGGQIFMTTADSLLTNTPTDVLGVKSLPKSFYAPLKVSTRALPLHLKLYHHLRHTRPLWYRKYHSYPLAHYFHFGLLLVYTLILGFTIYHALIESPGFESPVLATLNSPPRMLSFSGRLTDDTNAPITRESNLRFGLYNDKISSGSALVWEEVQKVQPDQDGNFQANLGQNRPLSQAFLNDNPTLFLGIAIEAEHELSPRQQIATIPLAQDAQNVQGMLPTNDPNAGSENVLLALDSSGNLTIGGKSSPKFEATGGEFILSGQTLTLTTNEGSNDNVQITPDGSGIIDAQKPIQNTTNYSINPGMEGMVNFKDSVGIAAESSTQSALLINQNSTGNLISAGTNNSAKFTVDYLGSGRFAQDLEVSGNNLTTTNPIFNIANRNVINLSIGNSATSVSIGAGTGVTTVNNKLNVFGLISAKSGLTIAKDTNMTFEDGNTGAIPFLGAGAHVSFSPGDFNWDNNNRRLGLGTTTPAYKLDIQDDQGATIAARIYNTNTGDTAEGLTIRLGNTSSNVSSNNHFVNFETAGAGVVGSIKGNGSNGIQIALSSPGDWAEYIQKNPQEFIPFGALVCVQSDGNARACDETTATIIGVASEHPTVIAGQNNGEGSVPVGLTGLVKTLVSTENGNIVPGDLITVSSTPGVGVKALHKGFVVGRALEGYTNSNTNDIGTILITLQTSWFDPKTAVSSAGDVLEQPELASDSSLTDILEKLKAGIFEAKTISTQTLKIASDNLLLGTKSLKEYIDERIAVMAQQPIISPIGQFERLSTDFISPLASDSAIALRFDDSQISIINSSEASTSAVATFDNQGNASLSGTLRAKKIIADEIEGLNIHTATSTANYITNITNVYTNTSSSSADMPQPTIAASPLPLIPDINAEYARFNQGVIALGASSLNEVSVTGTLHVGQSLTLSENSVNTIGASLELQPLRQGNLSIMGGLVTIDIEGNLSSSGSARFAKDVKVNGTLTAGVLSPVPNADLIIRLTKKPSSQADASLLVKNDANVEVISMNQLGDVIASGTASFKKIATNAFTIIRGVQADTSFTQTTASGSAGTAVITANETERTIVSPYMKENSLIYITPTSETYGVTPYIARQNKNSFTIQIYKPVIKNIKLNWWIIN